MQFMHGIMGGWVKDEYCAEYFTLTYRYVHVEQRLVEFNMLKITAVVTVLITPSLMSAQDLCDTLGALQASLLIRNC